MVKPIVPPGLVTRSVSVCQRGFPRSQVGLLTLESLDGIGQEEVDKVGKNVGVRVVWYIESLPDQPVTEHMVRPLLYLP